MQPAVPSAGDGLQDGTQSDTSSAARKLTDNLVNELKQADQVQGTAVNIQPGGHE
jgi:hypothetical protein